MPAGASTRRGSARPGGGIGRLPESTGTVADESLDARDKLALAFDLFEAGVAMMRATLRRRHPEVADAEIERRLAVWLRTRPGAEQGDAVGRPRPVADAG